MLQKVMTVRGWLIMILATLVVSFSACQQLKLNKMDENIHSLNAEVDHYVDENARLVGNNTLQEKLWREEMESLSRQMDELDTLREAEFGLLSRIKALEESDAEVEKFFSIPIPDILSGMRSSP